MNKNDLRCLEAIGLLSATVYSLSFRGWLWHSLGELSAIFCLIIIPLLLVLSIIMWRKDKKEALKGLGIMLLIVISGIRRPIF